VSPATVATSTNVGAVQYGHQRKGFYAESLFWAFFSNGTNAGWEFSADGTTWVGAFTSIGACTEGRRFSVWFDGTYVHYARYDNYDLFYRRGTPVNDGSINWSAVEQTVYDGDVDDSYMYPCISVDTNGYAWIGILNDDPTPFLRPYVLKNDNNNGTWATDFTYELNAADNSWWMVAPVPLTDGKVYVVYCRPTQLPLGRLWDGDWDAGEENDLADFNIEHGVVFSTVALGDNVHFVYNRQTTDQLRHNERVWGVGWNAADVLVQDNPTAYAGPALSVDPSAGTLYCFWTSTVTDHVYYKKYDAGWDVAATDWINEDTDDIQLDYLISSFYMDYGGYIGLLYVTKLASPYNVRFAFLTMALPPPDVGMGAKPPIMELLLAGVLD